MKTSYSNRQFSDSFLWRVSLRKGRKHSLKHHARFGTLLYEFLGIIDKMASNNTRRFVFAHEKNLLKLCNKGPRKDGEHFSLQYLKYVIAEVQSRHIMSPYFTTRDGEKGFFVAPHPTLCYRDGNDCVMFAPKRPEPMAADDSLLDRVATEETTAKTTGWRPQRRPTFAQKATTKTTAKTTDAPPQPCEFTNFTEDDAAKWIAERTQNGFPNRVSQSTGETGQTAKPSLSGDQRHVQEQRQEQPQEQEREFFSSPRLTDQEQKPAPMKIETIGDHFLSGVTVELITDGELNPDDTEWSKRDWKEFLGCMQAAVDAKADYPFAGRTTCAQLMGDSMKRLREEHNKNAPRPWVRVIKSLRETPGPANVKSADLAYEEDRERVASRVAEFAAELKGRK